MSIKKIQRNEGIHLCHQILMEAEKHGSKFLLQSGLYHCKILLSGAVVTVSLQPQIINLSLALDRLKINVGLLS